MRISATALACMFLAGCADTPASPPSGEGTTNPSQTLSTNEGDKKMRNGQKRGTSREGGKTVTPDQPRPPKKPAKRPIGYSYAPRATGPLGSATAAGTGTVESITIPSGEIINRIDATHYTMRCTEVLLGHFRSLVNGLNDPLIRNMINGQIAASIPFKMTRWAEPAPAGVSKAPIKIIVYEYATIEAPGGIPQGSVSPLTPDQVEWTVTYKMDIFAQDQGSIPDNFATFLPHISLYISPEVYTAGSAEQLHQYLIRAQESAINDLGGDENILSASARLRMKFGADGTDACPDAEAPIVLEGIPVIE